MENPTYTGVSGIQTPGTFNLDMLQAGASNEAGVYPETYAGGPNLEVAPTPTGVATPQIMQADTSESTRMSDELAAIRALNQGQASGGLGKTIGGAAGAGIGLATGTGPIGATVGGAAGGAVGSIVDYMIDKDASDKAEAKRKEAIKKQIEREKAIANSQAITEARAQRRGIALSREEAAMTGQDVINQSRKNMLQNLLNSINQKAEQDEVLKQKFLKSRRIA